MSPVSAGREQVQERLDELHGQILAEHLEEGRIYDPATGYHPAGEAGAGRDGFGICLVGSGGDVIGTGDWQVPFALQSISKVFTYGLALADNGRVRVRERVGVDPSGEPYNAIELDERHHRPYNPMVNAGALVAADLVHGDDPRAKAERVLDVLRTCAANPDLRVDETTLAGELQGADRNRAAAYLMRSEGMLDSDVEEVLETYLRLCSVEVTCRDLAVMAATLGNGCVNPLTRERALPRECVRDVLSVMYTCGMYDAAGQWACEVGVPAKSGVAGGIMAVIPAKLGIGLWSPGLDQYGNSIRGVRACREFSDRLGLHLFATAEEDALGLVP